MDDRRWGLIRDVLVFQAKMVLEGVRDLLLPIATLVAGTAGLVLGGERPERAFHDVLRAAVRFDLWLNLFGPIGERGRAAHLSPDPEGVDRYFHALEALIVEQHEKGALTRSARQTIDGWLDRLQQASRPRG
jgi:hypothetical protein